MMGLTAPLLRPSQALLDPVPLAIGNKSIPHTRPRFVILALLGSHQLGEPLLAGQTLGPLTKWAASKVNRFWL
ncbi:hypothetical protein KAV79_07150, partial [Candidatus Aerophobetes bacterium]|nr:hypothetical protein [Candidatus Aerophobetes bacterium]